MPKEGLNSGRTLTCEREIRAHIGGRLRSYLAAKRHDRRPKLLFIGALVLLSAQWGLTSYAYAQEIDFGQIDKFESLGTGTLQVGAAPKVIVDDSDRHTVILTIWDADAETKVYWTSPDGNASRTTIVPGKGVQTFQTAGEFKLEAIGEPNHEVQYGYVLLHLRKHKAGI